VEPNEINASNWSEILDEYLEPTQQHLTASVREHLSIEGQSAMRAIREAAPVLTVRTVEEE
jgi:hypothetical protein